MTAEAESPKLARLMIGGAVMYAIIATGGKQYKVSEGDVIKVEKLDAEVGAKVTFDDVLLVGGDTVKVGSKILHATSFRKLRALNRNPFNLRYKISPFSGN